ALTLDRLEQEPHGVVGHGRLERVRVAERDRPESGRERTEALAVLRLRAEPHDRRGAAMEVVTADDDLGPAVGDALLLVSPLPDQLDRGLDRLGARVHGQGPIVAGELA